MSVRTSLRLSVALHNELSYAFLIMNGTYIMRYTEIKSIDDLAFVLNVEKRQLTGLLYGKGIDKCYTPFEIPKKKGGTRKIEAPNNSLKFVQRKLSRLLLDRLEVVNFENNIHNNVSHGFYKKRSIKSNAQPHRNKKFLLNVDLEDFFGTIHFGRVQGYFKNNKYFKLPEVATIIAQLCCYHGRLPQGAPTSPVISNLICQILDFRIIDLCRKYKLTYTRYADDLTFSTNDLNFYNTYNDFLEDLGKLIVRSGFKINSEKTFFQVNNNRQIVTGLTVNKKINVKKDYYKNTRSMANNLYKNGSFTIDGKLGNLKKLEGRFSFINDLVRYNNQINGQYSLTSNSFEYQKNLRLPKEKNELIKNKSKKGGLTREEKLYNLTIKEKDFQKFLFYKYFIANTKATIITEGKTDSRYIKAALRRYYKEYPKLVEKTKEGFQYNISFLPRSNRLKYLFGFLDGGANDLKHLILFFIDKNNLICRNYLSYFKSIITNNPQKPVIFLVDNEKTSQKPLRSIIGMLESTNSVKKGTVEDAINSNFYYKIDLNAFLLTLPTDTKILKENKDQDKLNNIEIEDLLNLEKINNDLISELYPGKVFNPKNKLGDNKHIGKEIFSKAILNYYQSEKIDFSNFRPLLDIINNLSDDYTSY